MGLRFPALDAAPPKQYGRQASGVSGSVVSVDDSTMTARVDVAGSVVSARVGQGVKSVQPGDHVKVDWSGGTAAIGDVATAHPVETFTFSGVTPGTVAANTAAPTAISTTVAGVTGSVSTLSSAVPSTFSGPPASYDQSAFNGWYTRLTALRLWAVNATTVLNELADLLVGTDGVSGVKAQAASLRSLASDLRVATNTQSTALEEHRKVMATLAKQTLARERIAK